MLMGKSVKFIDLFAGIGGIRLGFEAACAEKGVACECVFTSEIKPSAVSVLQQNHPQETIEGDITQIAAEKIPPFDILLAGFPCQAFSVAGKRLGFEDTRGTLFFEVARILSVHEPFGFLLENVEGLVTHNKADKHDKTGKTLQTILGVLDDLGYHTEWKVLNAKDFGIAQDRKRVYLVGTRTKKPSLEKFARTSASVGEILEHGLPPAENRFTQLLLSQYTVPELLGKSVKDKRGGGNNIHSWDIEYKGAVTAEEKILLNRMLTERRKKKWADFYGIEWMDGMPLTLDCIRTFYDHPDLERMLERLVALKYLKKERPKRLVNGRRVRDPALPVGYNIVAGKMSFEVSTILDPQGISPTLVAMDMRHIYVGDGDGIRPLSLREGLRLFGYPDGFAFGVTTEEGYDLLGNTVVVPVIRAVAGRLLELWEEKDEADGTANL